MAKKLVIVESPAKAKTILKYLGEGYVVKASMGHVRDLPKSRLGVDLEKDFAPEYVTIADRRKVLGVLKKEAAGANEIYLATDLDREGEAIAWHIREALNLPAARTHRVTFNEITKRAIQDAFKRPSPLSMDKVNAQQARRILDRIVGYQLSPLLWKKISKGLSAGRVQSVAVRLIVDREREIEAFKPVEFWEIRARLKTPKGEDFEAVLVKFRGRPVGRPQDPGDETGPEGALPALANHVPSQSAADEILEALRDADWQVESVEEKTQALSAPPPFSTSTLQQAASTRLRMTARRTMSTAQQLYEGVDIEGEGSVGLITYMRTDSFRVSETALSEVRREIPKRFGKDYLPAKPVFHPSRGGAQEAHEAIRPTSMDHPPERVEKSLSPDQARLYRLIWDRFVASQMAPARFAQTAASISAGEAMFSAKGRRTIFDGFQRVWSPDLDSDVILPALAEGDALRLEGLDPLQRFTKPPPRFNEASLVRTLEREGIGRPSTYASILSTIQDRGYVSLEERRFKPTPLGCLVNDRLVEHFPRIVDVDFTSRMEARLDQIEDQKADWVEILRDFYKTFRVELEKAAVEMVSVKGAAPATAVACEVCGKPMVVRWSRKGGGSFLGCSGFPECKSSRPLEGESGAGAAASGEPAGVCEKCGGQMIRRTGRRGPFLGCSKYPACKNTRPIGSAPVPESGEPLGACDKCGAPMVRRSGRNGPFISCSAYPKCKNAKSMPLGVPCPSCGGPLVHRTAQRGGGFVACGNYPDCKYKAGSLDEVRAAAGAPPAPGAEPASPPPAPPEA